jgi:hypothetical protein
MCTGNLYPAGMANLYPASHCSTSFESMPLPLCPSVPSPKTNALFLSQLSGPGCSKKKTLGPGRGTHSPAAATRKPGPQDLRRPREAPPEGAESRRSSWEFSRLMRGDRTKRGSARGHHTPKADAKTPSLRRISRRSPEKAGSLSHTMLRIRERRPGCCPSRRIDLMASSAHACHAQGCCL